jgi:hypothetical protein
MSAAPPKPTLPMVVAGQISTLVGGSIPDPNNSWNLLMGALGYWLPHSINRSAAARAALRALR